MKKKKYLNKNKPQTCAPSIFVTSGYLPFADQRLDSIEDDIRRVREKKLWDKNDTTSECGGV